MALYSIILGKAGAIDLTCDTLDQQVCSLKGDASIDYTIPEIYYTNRWVHRQYEFKLRCTTLVDDGVKTTAVNQPKLLEWIGQNR